MSKFKDAFIDVTRTMGATFGEVCSLYVPDPYDSSNDLFLPSINVIVGKGKRVKGDFNNIQDNRCTAKIAKEDLELLPQGIPLLRVTATEIYELGEVIDESKTARWFSASPTSALFPTDKLPAVGFSHVHTFLKVNFTDTTNVHIGGSPIESWYWDFGDEKFSTTQNPQHTYTSTGHYNVKLTVTTVNGLTATFEDIINVVTDG